jgi:hypothetical protein
MAEEDFDRLLLEAIDEGLSSIGESSKQAIYYHLKKSFDLEKQEIPRKIAAFMYAIEKIFGLGANFLEILIMKRLYEKAGGRFKWHKDQAFTFTEYVGVAKRSFLEKSSGETVPWRQLMTES